MPIVHRAKRSAVRRQENRNLLRNQVSKTLNMEPGGIELKPREGNRMSTIIKNQRGVIRAHYSQGSENDTGKQRIPTRTQENPIKDRTNGRSLAIRPDVMGPDPRDFTDRRVSDESIERVGQRP